MDDEKRQSERRAAVITTVLRKVNADGSMVLMEFKTQDLSLGGIFIAAEDLSVFDLGEAGRIPRIGVGRSTRSQRRHSDTGRCI